MIPWLYFRSINLSFLKSKITFLCKGAPQKVSPTSTVIGTAILNSIISEAAKMISKKTNGEMVPVFASANMDNGDEFNKKLFAKYKKTIHYKY